ncbi:SDR family oxidoreductase [Limimaricola pyoseonensis]|uniref:NADP-dependent 3-hydroxy acid dehydrogenase YdfG n=1 Tax=Limimaricola pyoseonensis TaxID=521013 RepID=A0A1G7BUJ8_9RHOB|nr:SDR family oxidoreductase [Limimaricola pyoseonensis]SDE30791.1 NADP-dependent 3-hydroxy acid dehydrogenase YdfG [Limimaricola pyoseonensis]
MNILITGAGSGFGQLITADLLKAGHRVAGSMRDVSGRNAETAAKLRALGAEIVEIDVTNDASVEAGVAAARARLGRIDALVNNAGVGAHGLQENFSADDFRRLFEINLFGVQRMIRAVLPEMRERGEGLILNVSSLLGRVALPFYGPYNATKWALEALSENYRAELSAFGVELALVEPGGFPTGFMANLMQPASRDRDAGYGEMAGAPEASLAGFEGFLAQNPQQNPQLVSDAVVAVIGAAHGTRPFRTEVDRIGMAEPLKAYNDHLGQVTEGIYASLGIAGMLSLPGKAPDAA